MKSRQDEATDEGGVRPIRVLGNQIGGPLASINQSDASFFFRSLKLGVFSKKKNPSQGRKLGAFTLIFIC